MALLQFVESCPAGNQKTYSRSKQDEVHPGLSRPDPAGTGEDQQCASGDEADAKYQRHLRLNRVHPLVYENGSNRDQSYADYHCGKLFLRTGRWRCLCHLLGHKRNPSDFN